MRSASGRPSSAIARSPASSQRSWLGSDARCSSMSRSQGWRWKIARVPATGELVQPLPAGHIEAVVNGWRKYDEDATMLRMEQGAIVAGDVFARDGLLGFQSVESVECDISISHTLWRDEAAMFATPRPRGARASIAWCRSCARSDTQHSGVAHPTAAGITFARA